MRAADSLASIFQAVRTVQTGNSEGQGDAEEREIFSMSENEPEAVFIPTIDYLGEIEKNPQNQDWIPVKSTYGNWQIRQVIFDAELGIITVYYDPISKTITDKQGRQITDLDPPPQAIIDLFYQIVATARIPEIAKENDGKWRHKKHKCLVFDKEKAIWKNTRNNSYVPGLPAPVRELVRHAAPSVQPSNVSASIC